MKNIKIILIFVVLILNETTNFKKIIASPHKIEFLKKSFDISTCGETANNFIMAQKIDIATLIGKKYNLLTILKEGESHVTISGEKKRKVVCQCDCGNIKTIKLRLVMSGNTQSCGCYFKELMKNNMRGLKHNLTKTSEYKIWTGIKERCFNPNSPGYKDYGGRGITVSPEWQYSFETFLLDMGKKPKGLSIDRIDNNGNYCKENCRWATPKEQGRNKRNNRLLSLNGVTKCVSEWGEELNIDTGTLLSRINEQKWSIEKALTTPVRK